jgi:hypothetical protein
LRSGDAQAWSLAGQAAALFRGARFSGVRCKAALVAGGARSGRWWTRRVTIPFDFDERA